MARRVAPAGTIFALVAVLLIAAFFRFHLLGADVRFHPDEAFFAAFARNAAVRGEWLLPGDLDKTPLAIYTQTIGMLTFGIEWDGAVWRLDARQGEFAARLATAYLSLLLVAVTARFAAILGLSHAGRILATAWTALSAYTIAFSATAFTDTPMLLLALLALTSAYRGRPALAGLWWIAAYAAKQQALLFAPLIALALWQTSRPRDLWRLALSLAVGVALLATWEAARPDPPVWALATANNAPDTYLVPSSELPARLLDWARLGRWLFGLAGTPALLLAAAIAYWKYHPTAKIAGIWAFIGGYALLHLFISFNVYDRYLLPLVPLIAVAVAYSVRRRWMTVLGWTAAALMLPAAWTAAHVHPAIGGDRGQHDGIIALANDLNRREFGAIVYDRWLGWELNYYLGAWTDKRRAYYPSPFHLLADPALYAPDPAPRYLPAPRDANVLPWQLALRLAGFHSCVGYTSPRFQVIVLARKTSTSAYSAWKTSCHNGTNRLE